MSSCELADAIADELRVEYETKLNSGWKPKGDEIYTWISQRLENAVNLTTTEFMGIQGERRYAAITAPQKLQNIPFDK